MGIPFVLSHLFLSTLILETTEGLYFEEEVIGGKIEGETGGDRYGLSREELDGISRYLI